MIWCQKVHIVLSIEIFSQRKNSLLRNTRSRILSRHAPPHSMSDSFLLISCVVVIEMHASRHGTALAGSHISAFEFGGQILKLTTLGSLSSMMRARILYLECHILHERIIH